MEMFSPNYATAHGRAYAASNEEYLQESFEPPYRLTNSELQQIREIREEIESRPKLTRFEARYVRVLKTAEKKLCSSRTDCNVFIAKVREFLNQAARTSSIDDRSVTIALLVAAIQKQAMTKGLS